MTIPRNGLVSCPRSGHSDAPKAKAPIFKADLLVTCMKPRCTDSLAFCNSYALRMRRARVCRLDNRADGFLVEAFEAAFALEILQVTANGTLGREFLELRLGDQAGAQQAFGAFAGDRPALALREGLLQERKI